MRKSDFKTSANNWINGDSLKENNYAYFIAYDYSDDKAIGVITLGKNGRSVEISMWLDENKQGYRFAKPGNHHASAEPLEVFRSEELCRIGRNQPIDDQER